MSEQDTSGYQVLLTRARRNFALCVVQLQNTPGMPTTGGGEAIHNAVAWAWRQKADRLQFAINAASGLAAGGALAQACKVLAKENAAR